jgi:hypothetical protein
VHDVVIHEAAHDVGDRVDLADVRQELVAEPFALGGAGDQAGDIDEPTVSGSPFPAAQCGELRESRIGHRRRRRWDRWCKGRLPAAICARVRALNRVDLPTFGSPTIPHWMGILRMGVAGRERSVAKA